MFKLRLLSLQEPIMYEFDCHYRKERWHTAQYFDLIKEFLIAAQNGDTSDDCEPPPCPTTPQPVTEEYLTGNSGNRLCCAGVMCLIRTNRSVQEWVVSFGEREGQDPPSAITEGNKRLLKLS